MTVSRDLESQIEAAWIEVLGDSTDITASASVRSWRDGSQARAYPVALVHCSPVGNAEESTRGVLYTANVEIGVQTDTVEDKDQATLLELFGAVRDVCMASGLLASLNAADDSNVVFNGVEIESGEHEIDDDEVSQISLTAVCHAYHA